MERMTVGPVGSRCLELGRYWGYEGAAWIDSQLSSLAKAHKVVGFDTTSTCSGGFELLVWTVPK